MEWLWITLLFLVSDIHTIQTHIQRPVRFIDNQKPYSTRHFRHIDSSVSTHFDWEQSLREATVQALYREHVGDPNLRKHIYSAPFLGKQNKATPFGDIAILARGQLYANYAGYIFVQDPYQNNCDDCQNIDLDAVRARCIASHCQIWHPRNNEHVIVLWSIKRIRHRSEGYNKMEFEYTISPVGFRHSKERYVTKDGTFNYNLPGHVFLLKSLEKQQNLDLLSPKVNQFNTGALVAQTLDGTKYIIHSFPGLLTLEQPGFQPTTKDILPTSVTTTTQYAQEDPKKVYQTLLEVLHQKTSTEVQGFTPEPPKTTIAAATTLVQFPDGQVIPITDLGSSFITKTTPNYVTIRFPEAPTSQTNGKYTSVTPNAFKPSTNEIPPTTSQTSTKPSTPHEFYTTPFLTTPSKFQPIYTESQKPITAKPHMKTTFHFYAAEEPTKQPITTTQQQYTESEVFLIDTVKPTTPTRITTLGSKKTTQRLKETNTKWPFTTVTSPRPSTAVKVTQPIRTTHATEQTTKPAYSDFSIPIMVLEEETPVSATAQESLTVTEATTKTREPATTNNQFYTTNIPPYPETTTFGTTRVTPTYVTKNEDIKTTMGVTRIMGTTQNFNTGMTFYAAEDTESTGSISNEPATKVTPFSTNAPKKIVTMIGKVTVKTTSFYPEEELFGLTKAIPKKSKPTKSLKVSPTQASDFLVDANPQPDKSPLFKKPLKDYNEDDIFGSTKTTKYSSKKTTVREYSKSDLEQALFDTNNRRSNALINRKSTTTEATPSKELYSSYFETSTLPMTTEIPQATTPSAVILTASSIPKRKLKLPFPKLKKVENNPVTSQSYLTSISYEVNKIEKPRQINNTTKKIDNAHMSKATIKRVNPTIIRDSEENDFALRLVGQAKGVAYLDQTLTTGASTAASVSVKTTKKAKYTRRRSYIARAKRPVRKKIEKDVENTK